MTNHKVRVFLDANILFSVVYAGFSAGGSSLQRLWKLEGVQLVTSLYTIEEAMHNLVSDEQKTNLSGLLTQVETVFFIAPPATLFRDSYGLPEKDIPVLHNAIDSGCDYLITGDLRHFGRMMKIEEGIEGVRVMRAAEFLKLFSEEEGAGLARE